MDDTYTSLTTNWQELLQRYKNELTEDEKQHLAQICIAIATGLCWDDYQSVTRLFKSTELLGIHILPAHYYSPLPILSELDSRVYEKKYSENLLSGGLDKTKFANLLNSFKPFVGELDGYPSHTHNANQFYWNNSMFSAPDAIMYYATIRKNCPRKIIEIGSGFSTLVAVDAVGANGVGEIVCIEPNPSDALRYLAKKKRITLMEKKVQTIPVSFFEHLKGNDILFIDSSHISKIGSDVNYQIFDIIPSLQIGVLVHIHDIFFPSELPRYWVEELNNFYNEQYIWMAFLMGNKSWEIELAANFICNNMGKELKLLAGDIVSPNTPSGSSFWIRRVSA